ncbi:hypothetical protein AVDCRST_MAG81-1729, partial [uncultured Synechococcales cyanobacterium]
VVHLIDKAEQQSQAQMQQQGVTVETSCGQSYGHVQL